MTIDSGSNGVPGIWVDRGSRWASLQRTASPCSIAQPVTPAVIGLAWARMMSANLSRATTARRTPASQSTT